MKWTWLPLGMAFMAGGASAGKQRAIAFDIDSFGKKHVLDSLP